MSGLPGALFSKYKQYKEDTKDIVEWLASNAQKCGYDATAVTKKSKSKTKAKKKNNTAAAPSSSSNGGGTCVVKVREYVPMAQCIASSQDKKVIIPLRILKIFKRCIGARTDVGQWYELDRDLDAEAASSLSHAYFVDTLKRALQVLVPASKLQELTQNNFNVNSVSSGAKVDVNRFSHLEVQDIDEDAYEATENAETGIQPTIKKTRYTVEELNPLEEWHFAFKCLCDDIKALESQVIENWEAYADGEIDLTTAALATNTAIELVKKAEEEFSKLKLPDLYQQGNFNLPLIWYMECCIRADIKAIDVRPGGKYVVSMEAFQQARESYLLIYRHLIVFSNGVVAGLKGDQRRFAVTRPAHYGTYNPELEFEDLSDERQYEQISALLNDMLVTMGAIARQSHNLCDDMLLDGLAYLQYNQVPPPLWLCFACQVFLEIHFTLKTKSERPYEELRHFAVYASQSLHEHKAFMATQSFTHMRNEQDEVAIDEFLEDITEWFLNDRMKQLIEGYDQLRGTGRKWRVWKDFEFLKMSPLFSGLLKYLAHVQLQWKGISLLNDTGLVVAAHMYNALQANGYLTEDGEPLVWSDMEYLLNLHRAEDTFLGTRPKSIEDCTKRLALIQGVAPETFARRRRGGNHRVLRSRAGSKFLTPSTAVAKILGQKYLSDKPQDWHFEQLDAIIRNRFTTDRKKVDDQNRHLNQALEHIDISTEAGRLELLDVFDKHSPGFNLSNLDEDATPEEMTMFSKRINVAIKINVARSDCRWVTKAQDALQGYAEADRGQVPKPKFRAIAKIFRCPYGSSPAEPTLEEASSELGIPYFDESDIDGKETATTFDQMESLAKRWEEEKSLPLDLFIDILRDSLQDEVLDIQFDYFAYFRSAMGLMLKLQEALTPLLQEHLGEDAHERVKRYKNTSEGAVLLFPHLALLAACDPREAPNLLVLRPWLHIDTRPLQAAGKIMRQWLKEHGDDYTVTEEKRETERVRNVTRPGDKVRYVDEDAEGSSARKPEDRHAGWSSSVGTIDGLSEREMREVYDFMKASSTPKTVAETLAELRGMELDERDLQGIRDRDEMFRALLTDLKIERKPQGAHVDQDTDSSD